MSHDDGRGGGTPLRAWLDRSLVPGLVTRTHHGEGEWEPVAGAADLRWLPDEIERFFERVKIEVDVMGAPEPRVRLYLDADQVCSSSGPARALECSGPWSVHGAPYADWSAGEIQAGLAYICDPDVAADGPDGDGIRDNDCGVGALLAMVGMSCPMLGTGQPNDCDPLAALMEQLPDLRTYLDRLVVTLHGVAARWTVGPDGEPRLALRLDLGVDLDLASYDGLDLDDFVDLGLTWAQGSTEYEFGAGDRHCPAGLECFGRPCAPGVVWRGFLPVVGDPDPDAATVSWTTANLTIAQRARDPDFAFGWDPSFHWYVPPVVNAYIMMMLPDLYPRVEDAFRDLFDGTFDAIGSLISFVPEDPVEPPWDRFAFCDQRMEPICLFDCLRDGCVVPPVPPAPTEGLRLIETAAGASRVWWNAVADPLTRLNEYASEARFEFVGIEAKPRSGLRWTAVAQIESDLDCDGWPDHEDGCPTAAAYARETDSAGDTLADVCDVCEIAYRTDRRSVPRMSDDYRYRGETSALGPPADDDRDGIGNHCDLCPGLAIRPDQGRLDEEAVILPSNPSFGGEDADRDGWGDDCDNCPIHPNRDQWNCNAADELVRGSLRDRPTLGYFGYGDACDPYPCVDSCTAPDRHPDLALNDANREWADVNVCPVALDPRYGSMPPTEIPAADLPRVPEEITTDVRGCYCTQQEMADPLQPCRTTFCPMDGSFGGQARWNPARPATDAGVSYEYKPLYYGVFAGDRGDRLGGDPYAGYARYYSERGRTIPETWEWFDDACDSHVLPCGRWIRMWFKPHVTAGTWFHGPPYRPGETQYGPYEQEQGNTYTEDFLWATSNPLLIDIPAAWCKPNCPRDMARTSLVYPAPDRRAGGDDKDTRADVAIDVANPGMAWSDKYRFQTTGTNVAGIAVSGWIPATKSFGWVLSTKLAPGPIFDLVGPAVTFAYARNGDPYRYWTFGGIDVEGLPSGQMWAARLVAVDGDGVKTYVGPNGLAIPLRQGPPRDPAGVFYELAAVPPGNVWPPPRFGAVLACAGWEEGTGGQCDTNCPKVDVALGLTPPPDGVTQPAGALVLVGGEGAGGPLADIWRYEEVASWQPPSDVSPGETGPWPSGWRLTGTLPGVDGGLSSPGAVQIDRALWLIGGRTAAGPTSGVFRVDLETGTAVRMDAVGPAPAGRVSPAAAYDAANRRIVVFGGVGADGNGLPDTWGFELETGAWTMLVPACTSDTCPEATGHEMLRIDRPSGEMTLILDRPTNGPQTASWTFREGAWQSAGERTGPGQADCDGDTTTETLFGLRCGRGGDGFPQYGRLRCAGSGLVCRMPLIPAHVVQEYRMPEVRAMVAHRGEILTLHGSRVEAYRVGPDGRLTAPRSFRLRRAGHDLAAANDALIVADGEGISLYGVGDEAFLSRVEMCGRARRVFAEDGRAYVLGMLYLMIVDVRDPAAPVVLQRIRLVPDGDGTLRLRSVAGCGRVDPVLDRFCDVVGACGAFGRVAAALDRRRLFLHLFGTIYVLDVTEPSAPVVEATIPAGWVKEMVVEGPFLYANGAGHDTTVAARQTDGSWVVAGGHDVEDWVEGVTEIGDWVVRSGRGRLSVATRQ